MSRATSVSVVDDANIVNKIATAGRVRQVTEDVKPGGDLRLLPFRITESLFTITGRQVNSLAGQNVRSGKELPQGRERLSKTLPHPTPMRNKRQSGRWDSVTNISTIDSACHVVMLVTCQQAWSPVNRTSCHIDTHRPCQHDELPCRHDMHHFNMPTYC